MKKLFAICLLVVITNAASAQQNSIEVPQSVISAFHALYAPANTQWKKENYGHYQASFTLHDTLTKAVFDANGHWQHTFKKVSENAIPDKVMAETKKLAPGYVTVGCWFVQTPDNLMYNIEISKGNSLRNFTFDSNLHYLGDNYFDDLLKKKKS